MSNMVRIGHGVRISHGRGMRVLGMKHRRLKEMNRNEVRAHRLLLEV